MAQSTADPSSSPSALLQQLIRFDTTNPPGHEADCINFIDRLFSKAGFDTEQFSRSPERPNLITRLDGKGDAPPLLLYGHVDVVPADRQVWDHPPFSGERVGDYVWGRGAIDMKGGLAMMITALLEAKRQGMTPAGDIIFCALSDEEAGGDYGARFMVEEHADLFDGVKYAIGEFGGFTIYVGDQRFYLIQVAEKQMCWLRAKITGPGGHGAFPIRDGAMANLGEALRNLSRQRLPLHVTSIAEEMITAMADHAPEPHDSHLRQLISESTVEEGLAQLGSLRRLFDSILYNTVSPTVVSGGEKINVIPSEVDLALDGRILPSFTPQDLIAEIRETANVDLDMSIEREGPPSHEPQMGLFDFLQNTLEAADPQGVCIPFLTPGFTDGRYFAQLGIQTYGFLPMNLPKDYSFLGSVHAANERVPAYALEFGRDVLLETLENYTG